MALTLRDSALIVILMKATCSLTTKLRWKTFKITRTHIHPIHNCHPQLHNTQFSR